MLRDYSFLLTTGGHIRFNDEHILEHPEKIITGAKYSNLSTKAHLIGKIGANRLSHALITLGYLKPDDKWFKE